MSATGELRVSDADRERVAARLVAAHGEGRLTLAEYDERVRAAHAAVVGSDLAVLTTDLPAQERPTPPARPSSPVPGPRGRGAVGAWAAASLVNVLIWVAVVLGTGELVHPWWVWVAGPWGLMLATGALARRAGGAAGPSTVGRAG